MEAELQKFRQKKQAEENRAKFKEKLGNTWNSICGSISSALLPEPESEMEEIEDDSTAINGNFEGVRRRKKKRTENEGEIEESECETTSKTKEARLRLIVTGLKFLCWTFVWLGFVKIGFGAVFFTVSVLWFIWASTGNSKKKRGEKSAYSVFNKNCEAIDGTLKAEQLEKQMLYGGL